MIVLKIAIKPTDEDIRYGIKRNVYLEVPQDDNLVDILKNLADKDVKYLYTSSGEKIRVTGDNIVKITAIPKNEICRKYVCLCF